MEQFKKEQKQNKRLGFSLIEILIAFSVLTITVLACTSLITNSINNNAENSYRIQAYFLAEQGLEAIRNIRDSNWSQNIGFYNTSGQQNLWGYPIYPGEPSTEITNSSLTLTVSPLLSSQIRPNGATWQLARTTDSEGRLYINTINNLEYYTHSDGIYSPFRRVITISRNFEDLNKVIASGGLGANNLSSDAILVTSTVYYEFKNQEKNIELQTILTDWKNGPL